MQEKDPHFEDPKVKAAIREAMAGEPAPAALRQRIADALDAEQRHRGSFGWLVKLAVAAALLIGIGIAYVLLNRETPAPAWFADAMIATHDQCIALPDHHLLADLPPGDDMKIIGQRLYQQLGYPVMAIQPGDGWTFAGAGLCKVSNVPVAHLLFTRGDQTLSIFSISTALLYQQNGSNNGARYSQTEKGHQIAGFVYGGAIHCVVEYDKSGNVSLSDMIHLRERLGNELAAAGSHVSVQ